MPLFQSSVLKPYLAQLDSQTVTTAWNSFRSYFGNSSIQQNIRDSKEEQFQEGFLRELFCKVFGYTMNPEPNYNLLTELKNVRDSKKADGAILKEGQVTAVIELKSTKVTNLNDIEKQAFLYKSNQRGCTYVITANFEKIRFYIEDAVDYEEFNLFTLTEEQFRLLFFCLSKNTLYAHLPLTAKSASTVKEENITKKLYADYSAFKRALYGDVVKQNPQYDPVLLFRKTQKLLDRFLFILFAEDRLLLPPNSISEILKQWETLRDLDEEVPLYSRFKKYFGYLDTGHKGKQHDIFAYNGGLFAPDDLLDNLLIDDTLLFEHTQKLTGYDFETEVDVNILGHIFEHSLSEIEEITASTEGIHIQYKDTKRKRDGVFYTPKYITQYIVRHTIGPLCEQKKAEIGLTPDDFTADKRKNQKRDLLARLDTYRSWLLEISILDPACGSGAFLNEALDFLINEHRQLDEMNANLLGITLVLSDVENSILEHNIYGVDLNEESVEIAKLSLWLRTARKGRKLSSLNRNLKSGNSLIADVAVDRDKAFDWKTEFPDVFARGGFDVVIGNPPYVRQELLNKTHKAYFLQQFKQVANGTADLYVYFYEQGLQLLKSNGFLGYITPSRFIRAGYGKNLRGYLSNYDLQQIIDFGKLPVFPDASTFPVILVVRKSADKSVDTIFAEIKTLAFDSLESEVEFKRINVAQSKFQLDNWQITSNDEGTIFDKMRAVSTPLKEYISGKIQYGLKTGFNEAFIINNSKRDELIRKHSSSDEIIKLFVVGDNVRYFRIDQEDKFVIFTRRGINIENYPSIKEHLQQYYERLSPGTVGGRKAGSYKWYEVQDALDYYEDFEKPKIIYPVIAKESRFTLDLSGAYCNDKAFIIPTDDLYLLAVLNSKLIWAYLKRVCSVLDDYGSIELRSIFLRDVPIAQTDNKEPLSILAQRMLDHTKAFQKLKAQFIKILHAQFLLPTISKKMEDWPKLSFKDFVAELVKQKVKLSLGQQAEWMSFLEEQQTKANSIQTILNATEQEINQLVYQLYGLTTAEIAVVERTNIPHNAEVRG